MSLTKYGYPEDRAAAKIGELPRSQWPTLWLVRREMSVSRVVRGDYFLEKGVITGYQRVYVVDVATRFDHIDWGIMDQPIAASFLGIPVRDELIPGPAWDEWREEDHPNYSELLEFIDEVEIAASFDMDDRWLVPVEEFMEMKRLRNSEPGDRCFAWNVPSALKHYAITWEPHTAASSWLSTTVEEFFEIVEESEYADPTYWND